MKEILIGAIAMWVLIGALDIWKAETNHNKVYNVLECAIDLPWVIMSVVVVIIAYPIACVWKFIRNAVRPVRKEAWDKCKFKHFVKFGNFRLVYDEKAKAFCNKLFLVRIANPSNEVKHEPKVIFSDEPSAPEGEYRIGKS